MQWGLVPFWAKDPTIGNRLINARAESLDEKPSFKYAFAKRRCLIVADGFYEWKKPESGAKSSQPYYFSLREGKAFVFAGLWESWQPKDDPESKLITCTIITTVANALVAKVHDRMPVILNAEDKWAWLREDNPAALKALLKPAPDDLLQAWEVSRAVNDPKNDSPECIKPLQEGFGGA
jgi:putative SOS response-associated peptidase YedK